MTSAPETLVLRRAVQRPTRRDAWILAIVTLALAVVTVWFFDLMLAGREIDWAALGAKLREKILENPDALVSRSGELIFMALASAAAGWYLFRVVRHEKLTLDRAGIHYQSPLPAFLAALQPSWSHSWAQIRSAEIATPRLGSAVFAFIVLDAVTVKRKIMGQWVAEGAPRARQSMFHGAWRRPSAEAALRELEQSPLVEFIRRQGVKVTVGTKAQGGFALESNRAALVASVAVLALLMYAVADIMINSETYAAEAPLAWFVIGGAVAFLVGATILVGSRVPLAEALALALLVGGAVGASLYPGLLRVNQLTDANGPRPHEYHAEGFGVWEPVHAGLPKITFEGHEEYWDQFRRGARREFVLRRGLLGFYQIDMAPVGAEIRAHREKRRSPEKPTASEFLPPRPPGSSA